MIGCPCLIFHKKRYEVYNMEL
uniref:Uncharacterized protein n=1 Tax=Rhizophora mucronata TaxID=61149 RepID=A0A2P2PP68_RHIMU